MFYQRLMQFGKIHSILQTYVPQAPCAPYLQILATPLSNKETEIFQQCRQLRVAEAW